MKKEVPDHKIRGSRSGMTTPFTWEEAYKRTWEDTTTEVTEEKRPALITKQCNPYKRGVIRHLHVLIDSSEKIDTNGYIPSYRSNIIRVLDDFIVEFYKENPISILSLQVVNDCKAGDFIRVRPGYKTKVILNKMGRGYFSLKSGLDASICGLERSSSIREVLIITHCITIRESEDLQSTIVRLKELNITVHCINLCAELMILKEITLLTNGHHLVPLNLNHFKQIMLEFTIPCAVDTRKRVTLMKFGFPRTISELSVCSCHLELTESGYECPVCLTKVCELPIECPLCSAQLVSYENINKTLYHQYPLKIFEVNRHGKCGICEKSSSTMCPDCGKLFCEACDSFLHECILFCPFCPDTLLEHAEK